MKADDITRALDDVGKKWTRQIKAEEKHLSARSYRASMYTLARTSLKEICYEEMQAAWDKASGNGRLPTHWRQVFYVMRPICDSHLESDRPLTDATFKGILESYLDDFQPGWDVLRGARGVFKEPHRPANDNGLPMSTMTVRGYLNDAQRPPSGEIEKISSRFPTCGAHNRIAAALICEKEGFDDLLEAEHVPERFDLALMSTKGISARAARDLAGDLGVPCFTLHDLDKNGFVMAAGFPFATDLGIRMEDVERWNLAPEEQRHRNPRKTYWNLLQNGASEEEAEFVSGGQRVELNMFTGGELIRFVEEKLEEHGVEKVVPDDETLAAAWRRAHLTATVNKLIARTYWVGGLANSEADNEGTFLQDPPPMPADLATQILNELDIDPAQSWDDALWSIVVERDGDKD